MMLHPAVGFRMPPPVLNGPDHILPYCDPLSASAAAPSSARNDPKQYVSIDDLESEIEQCTPPDKMDLMRTLLLDLRHKNLTLKEFCKRVRMAMGEKVLMQTVAGLRRAQENKSSK